jgi:hypothetical protein
MGQPGCATGIARLRVLYTGEERQQPLVIRCVFKPGDIFTLNGNVPHACAN